MKSGIRLRGPICARIRTEECGQAILGFVIVVPLLVFVLFAATQLGMKTTKARSIDLVLNALFESPTTRPYVLVPSGIITNNFALRQDKIGSIPRQTSARLLARDDVSAVAVGISEISIEHYDESGERVAHIDRLWKPTKFQCKAGTVSTQPQHYFASGAFTVENPQPSRRDISALCSSLLPQGTAIPCAQGAELACVGVIINQDAALGDVAQTKRAYLYHPVQKYVSSATGSFLGAIGQAASLELPGDGED